jgi:hypothetical protein
MAGFPTLMPLSLNIMVGSVIKSPYQWAAALAPDDKLIQYKNAMLWLEGEDFGSQSEFLAKVERIIKFQEEESHRPVASLPPPQIEPLETSEESTEESSSGGKWSTAKTSKPRKAKTPFVRWTRHQLAKAIVDGCVREMQRVFSFTGPSLSISTVYPQFTAGEFTYSRLIGAIRDEIEKLPSPSTKFGVPVSARYNAASSPGKGKNFNFKVQCKNSKAPNGWSAVAQIHVIWG